MCHRRCHATISQVCLGLIILHMFYVSILNPHNLPNPMGTFLTVANIVRSSRQRVKVDLAGAERTHHIHKFGPGTEIKTR